MNLIFTRHWAAIYALLAWPVSSSGGHFVIATDGRQLVDYIPGSGQATNPRDLEIPQFQVIAGMDSDSRGRLFLLTASGDKSLYRVDQADGSLELIGQTGLSFIGEGDVTFEPGTDVLYGMAANANNLFTVDTTTGASTLIGPVDGDDVSGLAFDDKGKLWALALNSNTTLNPDLLLLDKMTGQVLTRTSSGLDPFDIFGTAGMDARGSTLFVSAWRGNVYSIDTSTGVFTLFDDIPVSGYDMTWVPESSSFALASFGLVAILYRFSRSILRHSNN